MWKHWDGNAYRPSKFLRGVQIFLLVLIIIGLGLLATNKIWVPKLVDKILEHDPSYQETLKLVQSQTQI